MNIKLFKKLSFGLFLLTAISLLTACRNTEIKELPSDGVPLAERMAAKPITEDSIIDTRIEVVHDLASKNEKDLKIAKNPQYEIGETVEIQTKNREYMDGIKAEITGAFDATVYEVAYNPSYADSGVNNYEWLSHDELKDEKTKSFKVGDEVVIASDRLKGMKDERAIIEAVEDTTIYTIIYETTDNNKKINNHKWIRATNLSALDEQ